MFVKNTLKQMGAPHQDEFPCDTYNVDFNSDAEIVEKLKLASQDGRCIGLLSPQPGRGKTHLAIGAMLSSWQRNNVPANCYHFERADIMAHKLEKAGVKFSELFEEYTSYLCLCLDELGRNLQRGDRLELTQMVIYKLFDLDRKLIFTSPLTMEKFKALFDGSIIDRMNEGLVIELPKGRSYRQPGRKPVPLESLGPICIDQHGKPYRSFPGRPEDCKFITGSAEGDKEDYDNLFTMRANRKRYAEQQQEEARKVAQVSQSEGGVVSDIGSGLERPRND